MLEHDPTAQEFAKAISKLLEHNPTAQEFVEAISKLLEHNPQLKELLKKLMKEVPKEPSRIEYPGGKVWEYRDKPSHYTPNPWGPYDHSGPSNPYLDY